MQRYVDAHRPRQTHARTGTRGRTRFAASAAVETEEGFFVIRVNGRRTARRTPEEIWAYDGEGEKGRERPVNKRLTLRGYTYLRDLPEARPRETRIYRSNCATRPDARLAINEEVVTRRGRRKKNRHLYQNGDC